MSGELEPRELRVSDAEREHVGELLQRAVGQGPLTVHEFTERMDVAMAARTRGELNAMLLDLPGATLTPAGAKDVLELHRGVGDTVLVIPEGATVDSDGVRTSVGAVKDSTVKRRVRGSHHFVVRGSSKIGDVKIMHPSSWQLGPLTVHRPFRDHLAAPGPVTAGTLTLQCCTGRVGTPWSSSSSATRSPTRWRGSPGGSPPVRWWRSPRG